MAAARKRAKRKAKGKPLESGKGGRTLFTAPRRRKILEAVELGHYRKTAATLSGIDERTLKTWVAKGRDNVTAWQEGRAKLNGYGTFLRQLEAAEAKAEDDALRVVITEVAHKVDADPRIRLQAAIWYLEHKHPKRWGTKRLELAGGDGEPISVDVRHALLDRLDTMAERTSE